MKTEVIHLSKKDTQIACQSLYFGDELPDNYDKIKQIWLKTRKFEMNIGIPNEFYLDFSNYKENNSIKKITKLKKREKKIC